ncbi:MAG: hypothetical protein R3F17_05535 [Planctomycetota bacterium]
MRILRFAQILGPLLVPAAALAMSTPAPSPTAAALGRIVQGDEEELAALLAAERAEIHLNLRRGRFSAAKKLLREHLRDDPEDGAALGLQALLRWYQDDLDGVAESAQKALANPVEPWTGIAARAWLRALEEQGKPAEARALLEPGGALAGVLDPAGRVEDAWCLVRLDLAQGLLPQARERAARAAVGLPAQTWQEQLAQGQCFQAAGDLVAASRSLVAAWETSAAGEGEEPDVLVALGEVYFESEQEVEARGKRSAGALFRQALELHEHHTDALLGLHALHRLNRLRTSRSPESILAELLDAHPNCIRGKLRMAGDDLADGNLPRVRRALAGLERAVPGRRDVRTLRAALSFVQHERDLCAALLDELTQEAPADSGPEREVGRYLVELYRFMEAIPFLEAAVHRDPADFRAWTRYGGALANVGREDDARVAFDQAVEQAQGRQDAWRDNMRAVLKMIEREHVHERHGPLDFSWRADASEVLRAYWVPFYLEAREELAQRYGFTPERTTIEVFREHRDFSVRSVGFEGFPALGVCFGPVVTALSPLSSMRGNFSWARTGFHEFSHVVHLGLSHNRCPRWITEGLATWEEVNRNPSWTRNMRLDLLEARANGAIIPVRELNRAFRGPRILFGYYEGGLLCRMLIEQHGFAPMVRVLEAFDRGADLDEAMTSVFGKTPEEIDVDFLAFVDRELEGIDYEPLHDPERTRRLQWSLPEDVPEEEAARLAWVQSWLTVGYTHFQQGSVVDAAEALRHVTRAGVETARECFLRAALAIERDDLAEAAARLEQGFALGGKDYRSLTTYALYLQGLDENEKALETWRKAEASFPGFPEASLSAELQQARLLEAMGRKDEAMQARQRWLGYNPEHYELHLAVARWHVEAGRTSEGCEWFGRTNEIDPFRRDLHLEWGATLRSAGKLREAIREYGVALIVPPELDLDHSKATGQGDSVQGIPLTDARKAEIQYLRAEIAQELGDEASVRHFLREVILLDPLHKGAVEWLTRLGAESNE